MGEYRAHRDVVAWALAVAFGLAAMVLTTTRWHSWAVVPGVVVAAIVLGTVVGTSKLALSRSTPAQRLMRRAHELARAIDDERTKPLLKAVDEHLVLVTRADPRKHDALVKSLVDDMHKAVVLLEGGPGPDFTDDIETWCRRMAKTVKNATKVLDS